MAQEPRDEESERGLESFLASLDDVPQTLSFPNTPGAFITAKHAGRDEDTISRNTFRFRAATTGEGTDFSYQPHAGFLAKCESQIVGFSLPLREGGSVQTCSYDPANGGRNPSNRRVYEAIFRQRDLLQVVEGFLDYVGGRDTGASDHFARLLAERPQLLTTTS